MDPAVALVQAYLELNGYLTIAEFPVAANAPGGVRAVTDIDVIALRFPAAAGFSIQPGPREPPDDALLLDSDVVDILICEVKEGRGRLNSNFFRTDTLRSTLKRVGCCPPDAIDHHVEQLRSVGIAHMTHALRCRARLALFAGRLDGNHGAAFTVPLHHVASFVTDFVDRHLDILRTVRLSQQALAPLALLAKLRAVMAVEGRPDPSDGNTISGLKPKRPNSVNTT